MQEINKFDFSGLVTGKEDGEGFSLITVSQLVAEKIDTKFSVLIAFAGADVNAGDRILILNAVAYEKDGLFRFKIRGKDQLIILKRNPDKGTLDAKDKFI